MIKGYIICLANHQGQRDSALKLYTSIIATGCELQPIVFNAVIPETIESNKALLVNFDRNRYRWNWPTTARDNHLDMQSGLYKSAYGATYQAKVEACMMSHMMLWDRCVSNNEPIVVLEADALFTRAWHKEHMGDNMLVGLNNPIGATRRAHVFDRALNGISGIHRVPVVNEIGEQPFPQGLAGNSAYYITPQAAKLLLDAVAEFGAWPNDAIMCRELFPWLRVVWPYYTKVQGTISTTTK